MKPIQKKRQAGFTLIELMIVIAVIGILAGFAIPAYQDYIARSQVSESIHLMSGAKISVTESYTTRAIWPSTADDAEIPLETVYELVANNPVGRYTEEIDGAGEDEVYVLTATLRLTNVNTNISGATLQMWTTNGGDTWFCGPGGDSPIEEVYLPSSCRDNAEG
ncbi:pilin [Magnetococcales bacterium HHB-1]